MTTTTTSIHHPNASSSSPSRLIMMSSSPSSSPPPTTVQSSSTTTSSSSSPSSSPSSQPTSFMLDAPLQSQSTINSPIPTSFSSSSLPSSSSSVLIKRVSSLPLNVETVSTHATDDRIPKPSVSSVSFVTDLDAPPLQSVAASTTSTIADSSSFTNAALPQESSSLSSSCRQQAESTINDNHSSSPAATSMPFGASSSSSSSTYQTPLPSSTSGEQAAATARAALQASAAASQNPFLNRGIETAYNAYWADATSSGNPNAGVLLAPRSVSQLCWTTFCALDVEGRSTVSSSRLIAELSNNGLLADDPRLAEMFIKLCEHDALHVDRQLDLETFEYVTHSEIALINKALSGELQVPDFTGLRVELQRIFNVVQNDRSGEIASYIPELNLVDPDLFAISVCTVDGQRFDFGDVNSKFSVQSCSKPISYMLALEEVGLEYVHQHVGREPSGLPFNEMALKAVDPALYRTGASAIPHNCMVNSGAIMTAALLIEKQPSLATRFKGLLALWTRLFGGRAASFSNATFLSEKENADRNWCLCYMMKEAGAFPNDNGAVDLKKVLDFYFQTCSIEAQTTNMATLAATLANGGTNPLTDDRVFHSKTVRHCLSLMLSCGMYDFSGEWQFSVGLPAKSGVSGNVFIVIPGVLGMCIYSPRLDKNGNSQRAVKLAQMLGQSFSVHLFSNLPCHDDVHEKIPASVVHNASHHNGIDDDDDDDDERCKAHHDVNATNINSQASKHHHNSDTVIKGETSAHSVIASNNDHDVCCEDEAVALPVRTDLLERRHQTSRHVDVVALLFAAASGDLKEIQRLVGKGASLRSVDYDSRSPLHVASSEGELDIVRYIASMLDIVQSPQLLSPLDRWGRTPLDDARNAGAVGADVVVYLRALGALSGAEVREALLHDEFPHSPSTIKHAAAAAAATTDASTTTKGYHIHDEPEDSVMPSNLKPSAAATTQTTSSATTTTTNASVEEATSGGDVAPTSCMHHHQRQQQQQRQRRRNELLSSNSLPMLERTLSSCTVLSNDSERSIGDHSSRLPSSSMTTTNNAAPSSPPLSSSSSSSSLLSSSSSSSRIRSRSLSPS